jgi:hypothetical protein
MASVAAAAPHGGSNACGALHGRARTRRGARETFRAGGPTRAALPGAGKAELRQHLQRGASRPYAERLADFHLLLYLAAQPGLEAAPDLGALAAAVHARAPVPGGYQLIIDSLADL